MYKHFFKRIIDLTVSFVLVLCLLPVFLIVPLLIKIDSIGPVFFRQKRMGKNAVLFEILKYRTMTNEDRKSKELYGRAEGITKIGYYLRRFKIDEMPQIFNVLKGDMSLVGPRPALPNQLENYTDTAKKRLTVKPGITGYSQVNGNIYLSWEDRWEKDKYYVEHISFIQDMKIILKTFLVVIYGERKYKK